MADREQEELGEEIDDFRRRVAELESVRALSAGERLRALETALFELRHAADRLWPRFRALAAGNRSVVGSGRQEERLLRELFQRHPLPVALLDRETVVRRLNHSAARLLTAGPGYATGRPLTGFLELSDRAAFRTQVAAAARGEGDRSLVVRLLPGAETVQVTLVALRPPGEPRNSVLAVLQAPRRGAGRRAGDGRPADAAQAAAGDSERETELLDVLDDVAAALLTAGDAGPEYLLRAAADALAAHCADWVIADLVEPDGTLRRVAVTAPGTDARHPPAPPEDAADLAARNPDGMPLVVAAATGGAISVQARPDDVECLGRDRTGAAMVARLGVTSLVCLPVCATPGGSPVPAVLTLLRTAKGGRPGFTMAEAGILDRAARLTALALAPVTPQP
jgi:PAS domain-containing protein